jgi:AcrR family transcriptional regulator
MGRKPTITRERLLELAEEIVRNEGPKALTVEALATSAGVSKGGIQYSFRSKDELIRALIERWTNQFDEVLQLESPSTSEELVDRYIKAMRVSHQATDAKMAGLLLIYLQNTENLEEARRWYRTILARLDGNTAPARAARVVFLAMEGLFLLRIIGVDDADRWDALLNDVEAVLWSVRG